MASKRFDNGRQELADRLAGGRHPLDPRIVDAFRAVPRELFLPGAQQRFAYLDAALPLAEGQTVSQPSMIAVMLQALGCEAGDRALEVGAGSGYASALLAQLVGEVFAVEIRPSLAQRAARNLALAKIENVHVALVDGSLGLEAHAPYDRILVSAGADRVPDELVRQLRVGGRIAIPVGHRLQQELRTGEKRADGSMDWQSSVPCIFVPLVTPGEAASARDEGQDAGREHGRDDRRDDRRDGGCESDSETEFVSRSDPPRRWSR